MNYAPVFYVYRDVDGVVRKCEERNEKVFANKEAAFLSARNEYNEKRYYIDWSVIETEDEPTHYRTEASEVRIGRDFLIES